jgi:hypothetical protein
MHTISICYKSRVYPKVNAGLGVGTFKNALLIPIILKASSLGYKELKSHYSYNYIILYLANILLISLNRSL